MALVQRAIKTISVLHKSRASVFYLSTSFSNISVFNKYKYRSLEWYYSPLEHDIKADTYDEHASFIFLMLYAFTIQ